MNPCGFESVKKSRFRIYQKTRIDKNGKEKEVTADDEAAIELRYSNNIVGKILVSHMSEISSGPSFAIEGDLGILKVENNELLIGNHEKHERIDLNYDKDLLVGFDNNLFTLGTYFLGKKIKKYLEYNESFDNPTLNDCLKNQQIIEESYKTLPNK